MLRWLQEGWHSGYLSVFVIHPDEGNLVLQIFCWREFTCSTLHLMTVKNIHRFGIEVKSIYVITVDTTEKSVFNCTMDTLYPLFSRHIILTINLQYQMLHLDSLSKVTSSYIYIHVLPLTSSLNACIFSTVTTNCVVMFQNPGLWITWMFRLKVWMRKYFEWNFELTVFELSVPDL